MENEKMQYLMHPETGELKAVNPDEVTPHSRKGWVGIQKAAYDRLVGTGTPNRPRPVLNEDGVTAWITLVDQVKAHFGCETNEALEILSGLRYFATGGFDVEASV